MIARISKMDKKSLMFVGATVAVALAVALAIPLYYVLMPAWIIVIREGEDENALPSIENRFKITESDLEEFPRLREAIVKADGNYPYVQWLPPVKALYWEGMKIVERFDMDSQYPPEYEAFLIYDDDMTSIKKVYHVQVVFSYKQQAQM